MALYDKSALTAIPSSTAMIGRCLNADLLELAQHYKKFVAKRYRLLKTDEIKHRIRDDEMYASIKLDGHFTYLCKKDGETFIFTYSGRVITGLPVLEEVGKVLENDMICACELYSPDAETGRSRVYAVTNALGEGGALLDNLKLAVFDILEIDGESKLDLPFEEVQKLIEANIPAGGPFHHVNSKLMKTDELVTYFNEVVRKQGHEGVVARNSDHAVYKIKPRHSVDVVVIGFTQQLDNPLAVSALLTALMRPDGTFQVFAKVGSGLSDEQRAEMYETLAPLEIVSMYKEADGNHTLFTMVKPTVIIQLAFLDVLMEKTNGKAVMKAVLNLDNDCYEVMMPERFVNVIAPVFEGVRDDKQVDATDLRMSQMQPYVDLTNLESTARQLDVAQSETLERHVYVKETKGVLSVRKFISWKTNKSEIDDSYPEYAFCYVDYSPGRKTPLARKIRTSNSRATIDDIVKSYLENEVKRGWKSYEEWAAEQG